MLDELPALIAAGYADVAEEDVVRLKWWGLYHDKPKVGTFMLRVKLAAGRLTAAAAARDRAPLARPRQGRGRADDAAERAAAQPPARGAARGVRAAARRRADEPRRLRRHGARDHGVPGGRCRARRALRRDAGARRGASVLHRQPGLRRPPAQAQDLDLGVRVALQRAGDQLHLARRRAARRRAGLLRARRRRPRRPFPGSPATSACSSGTDEAIPVLRAILDTWRDDLRWRVSRVKSRMKFMVDALGPEGVRAEVERRLGYALPSFALPPIDVEPDDHLGIRDQPDGRRSVGVPVHVGLLGGARLVALADAARAARRGGPDHAPAEPRARERPGRRCRRRRPGARRAGAAARARRAPRERDRVHGRAALQLLGDGDQDAARRADRRARAAVRRERRTAAAAPRRMPARVRAALGRGHRLPGDDRARRGRTARPGLRRLPPRRPRAACGDRAAGVPARADAAARRARARARRRLARRIARTARACGRFSTGRRTRSSAGWPGASRRAAGERRRQRDQHRAPGRPRGGRALGRVRGARALGRARVGARAVRRSGSPSRPPSRTATWR